VSWLGDRIGPGWWYGVHLFGSALLVVIGVKCGLRPMQAAILAAFIGLGKEGIDAVSGGNAEWLDLACDAIGILIGYILTGGGR
jgi:hypothetical protein